ncbi:MAG: tRNA pseudouridine(54/55) synthase Pus10 [Crenarchaeota archaeon]|nr:tRNA pseudouridine(54/55) synthase Pus10 [Thermoproteota archaeon]MDW8034362.1 tRNA pseudouridine(54/55) synthase Pus10 [Nitrososphaerota archaeon]
MDLLNTLRKILVSIPLCNRCLGRQFSSLIPSYDNETKGRMLKDLLFMSEKIEKEERSKKSLRVFKALAESGHDYSQNFIKKNSPGLKISPKPCYICGSEINQLINKAVEKIVEEASKAEFDTFYVGLTLPISLEEKDEKVKSFFKLGFGEALKNDLNREINQKVGKLLGKKVRMKRPDVLFVYDAINNKVTMQINSIFLRSSYRKLVGGIAQTKWRGMDSNDVTPSIEKMLEEVLIPAFKGRKLKFHGAGREDVDVKMLGDGRPFIVEIIEPKVRNIDLNNLHLEFNRRFGNMVEVFPFTKTSYLDVPRLKKEAERRRKTYRIIFETEREVSEEELKEISEKLTGCLIRQRTPLRVLKRRGDRVRKKTVYQAFFKRLRDNLYEAIVTCSGGLYVKELLHGDEGRTVPSVASLLNTKVKIVEMEVTGIEGG